MAVPSPKVDLKTLYRRLDEGIRRRTLSEAAFRQLEGQALEASGGDGDLLEGFYQRAERYNPDWGELPSGGETVCLGKQVRAGRAGAKKTRTKADLIEGVALSAGLKKKDAKAAVDAFLSKVEDALKGGKKVQLTGFGTFEVKSRKAKTGVKPGTTTKIKIPSAEVPAFRPGKALKEKVKK